MARRARVEEIRITRQDALRLVRMLGGYQNFLESGIDGEVLPGEHRARDPKRAPLVASLRRRWKEAEAMVARLYTEFR
jgi:hypothetical protein